MDAGSGQLFRFAAMQIVRGFRGARATGRDVVILIVHFH